MIGDLYSISFIKQKKFDWIIVDFYRYPGYDFHLQTEKLRIIEQLLRDTSNEVIFIFGKEFHL